MPVTRIKSKWSSGSLMFYPDTTDTGSIIIGDTTNSLFNDFVVYASSDVYFQVDVGNTRINMVSDLVLGNAKSIKTGSTASDSLLIGIYDTDAGSYSTWATLLVGSTPSWTFNQDITFANGKAIMPSTTDAQNFLIKIYDTDAGSYSTWATLANGSTPTWTFNQDITFANGKAIMPSTTSGQTLLFKIFDTDAGSYSTWATLTNGSSPSWTFNDDIIFANGKSIKTTTTTGNTFKVSGYDVDAGSFSDFITITNGSSPSLTLGVGDGMSISNATGSYVFAFASTGTIIKPQSGAVGTAEAYITVKIDSTTYYIYLFDNAPGA